MACLFQNYFCKLDDTTFFDITAHLIFPNRYTQ